MGHLSLHCMRCFVIYLPRPAAVALMVVAMVVGVATAPMRSQAWFSRLSPPLVSERATSIVAVSVTAPSAGSVTAWTEVSATTPAAGSAEVTATFLAKVPVSGATGCTCGGVSGHLRRGRRLNSSTGMDQALGPPPEPGVVMRDERFSLSRVAPEMTVEVTGRMVTYQEVAVVSLPEFKCATACPNPAAAAVMTMTAAAVLATVVAAPGLLLPQAGYGAGQPSMWCLPMLQTAQLPKVHLRAAWLPPATK